MNYHVFKYLKLASLYGLIACASCTHNLTHLASPTQSYIVRVDPAMPPLNEGEIREMRHVASTTWRKVHVGMRDSEVQKAIGLPMRIKQSGVPGEVWWEYVWLITVFGETHQMNPAQLIIKDRKVISAFQISVDKSATVFLLSNKEQPQN